MHLYITVVNHVVNYYMLLISNYNTKLRFSRGRHFETSYYFLELNEHLKAAFLNLQLNSYCPVIHYKQSYD